VTLDVLCIDISIESCCKVSTQIISGVVCKLVFVFSYFFIYAVDSFQLCLITLQVMLGTWRLFIDYGNNFGE